MHGSARRCNVLEATLLIRILVGCVFLSEGIQKSLFPEALGVGRFTKARTDVSMLLGLVFLLVVGGGRLALDARYPEGLDPKS